MHLSVEQARRQAIEALRPALGAEAAHEAGCMLAHVLGCDLGALPAHREDSLDLIAQAKLGHMVEARQRHKPLQYLIGEWSFMGLPLLVRPEALIPRPDTETLAERAIALAQAEGYHTALDLCTGTGCVAIALSKLGGLAVTASDVSPACIALAERNAARHRAAISFVVSDWFENLPGAYDLIVANPPYLTHAELEHCQPELRYEPALALDGGPDGLDSYRALAAQCRAHLNPGGAILLEVGAGQAAAVAALFGGRAETFRDLAGIERVVCIRYEG